jgi:hypothetical protein
VYVVVHQTVTEDSGTVAASVANQKVEIEVAVPIITALRNVTSNARDDDARAPGHEEWWRCHGTPLRIMRLSPFCPF